jgi:hypothetical protein
MISNSVINMQPWSSRKIRTSRWTRSTHLLLSPSLNARQHGQAEFCVTPHYLPALITLFLELGLVLVVGELLNTSQRNFVLFDIKALMRL